MSEPLLAGLLVLLLVLAIVALRAADLLLAAIALAGYGFAMSLVWAELGAVDVEPRRVEQVGQQGTGHAPARRASAPPSPAARCSR